MDRLTAMRVFTRVVERCSFTLAATDTGLPRSTVTDAVKQLEARLGVRLLDRTTRHVSPTLDGAAYYQRCLTILADIEDAEGAFAGAKPKGILRVDVHGTLARHFVLPKLSTFLAGYPDIRLHMSEGDRLVDLIREGIDCALRVGEPREDDMITRRVALLEEVTVAAPAYLTRYGRPVTLDDLAEHRAVAFWASNASAPMPMEFLADGTTVTKIVPPSITVNAAETYVLAARLGLGIIQVPRYHVQADLDNGTLVQLLADYPVPATPASLLYPRGRQLSPRVRVFTEWLRAVFRDAH